MNAKYEKKRQNKRAFKKKKFEVSMLKFEKMIKKFVSSSSAFVTQSSINLNSQFSFLHLSSSMTFELTNRNRVVESAIFMFVNVFMNDFKNLSLFLLRLKHLNWKRFLIEIQNQNFEMKVSPEIYKKNLKIRTSKAFQT